MEKERRIIIVEDDLGINELIAYNLKKEGFLVEQVFSGEVAQRRISSNRYDVVILDIMLPGVDGFSLCRQIKEIAKNWRTFVIILSVRSSEQDKLYAHILGADCYLSKPFRISDLISVVKEFDSLSRREFTVSSE
jgi:DNA-binding response OmpR family regulator